MKKFVIIMVVLAVAAFTGGYFTGRPSAETQAMETLVAQGWSLVPPSATANVTTTVVRR